LVLETVELDMMDSNSFCPESIEEHISSLFYVEEETNMDLFNARAAI
jgi:hypothetical protein